MMKNLTLTARQEWLKEKSKELFVALKDESIWSKFYHLIFVARRLLLVIIALFMQDTPVVQTTLCILLSLFTLVFLLAIRPYEEASGTNFDIFNEIAVYFCCCLTQ